ncbi:LDH2 family malate/lactate/ureidoglycolate dehydrogenase [Pseudochelatococcus lubricantis]|uniref:LDH2 family malate/lactate/ureidoglycolate dehydrogenase n=1 Tax=Pseudochelatococcus lubricantis TaxID=1538102 RepID=A0ABX0UZA8_9HYPH|nr:Ldh family oxidoreductase [Pseudochelatococcus lubricantis]NIJ58267.1 LDH2 family malate/lactate/ureidoglycolate dehydrogenase [Pseudochelatococcus lubricantis]
MTDHVVLSLDEARALGLDILRAAGLSEPHAQAIADVVIAGQRDECHSHGLYRLPGVVHSIRAGKVDPQAVPDVVDHAPGVVRVDAHFGFSPLAFALGRPKLVEKARRQGIAALAINNCFHFSALWPEVEAIAAEGVVALALTPSHSWVAPAGGTKPVFGTNPIAFAWPRPDGTPFVFDFATSVIARGDIELHRRAGKPLQEGWAIDGEGTPTTDAEAALAGAMLTFGGHKGSALAAMIELLAGPLIGDMTSAESMAFDDGARAAPCHGELILALDPAVFLGVDAPRHIDRAEKMFGAIVEQGARLPSQRRYEARRRSLAGGVSIPKPLHDELVALRPT